jgi:hypothetical protein
MSNEERYGAMRVVDLRNEVSASSGSLVVFSNLFFESCECEAPRLPVSKRS